MPDGGDYEVKVKKRLFAVTPTPTPELDKMARVEGIEPQIE